MKQIKILTWLANSVISTLVVLLCSLTSFGQVQMDRPGNMEIIRSVVDVRPLTEVEEIRLTLKPGIIEVDSSLVGIFYDRSIMNEGDLSSFEKAFKCWEFFRIESDKIQMYLGRSEDAKQQPLRLNNKSLIKILLHYKIDRVVVFPEAFSSQNVAGKQVVYMYPLQSDHRAFVNDLKKEQYVLDIKIGALEAPVNCDPQQQ